MDKKTALILGIVVLVVLGIIGLVIAIFVLPSVLMYFWVGGLTTHQPTPHGPATISAYAVTCASDATGTTTIVIANTSPPGVKVDLNQLKDSLGNAFDATATNSKNNNWYCDIDSNILPSGEQVKCHLNNAETAHPFKMGSGTITLYGATVASAPLTC